MHSYTSNYSQGTHQYKQEYDPDECSFTGRASNFWCFKYSVEKIRNYMIRQQIKSSKLIWFC